VMRRKRDQAEILEAAKRAVRIFSIFQVGNKKRSQDDLKDCQEGRIENSGFQEGNEMRSLDDLIEYQEGKEEIPYFQVGKGEQMRLSKSFMNSGESSYQ
jgi:hypothetical protein